MVFNLYEIIHPIKTIGLACYPMPIRAQARPIDGTMVAVARHVRRVAVKGIPCDQAGIEVGEQGRRICEFRGRAQGSQRGNLALALISSSIFNGRIRRVIVES